MHYSHTNTAHPSSLDGHGRYELPLTENIMIMMKMMKKMMMIEIIKINK